MGRKDNLADLSNKLVVGSYNSLGDFGAVPAAVAFLDAVGFFLVDELVVDECVVDGAP